MCNDDILQEFEDAFADAWAEGVTLAERFENLGLSWGTSNNAPTWTVNDPATGLPKKCSICGCTDDWVFEGTAFICEHGIMFGGRGYIRVLDSIGIQTILEPPKQTGRYRQQRSDLYED